MHTFGIFITATDIGLTPWPSNARPMQVHAMSLKGRTFIRSAIAIDESQPSVFFRDIMPIGIYPVIVKACFLSVAVHLENKAESSIPDF